MRSSRLMQIVQVANFMHIEQGSSLRKYLGLDRLGSANKTLREGSMSFVTTLPALNVDVALRAIRMLVGVIILMTILTAILIPQVLPVSGSSFVNAKLEWIRTPIEGDLEFSAVRVGDKINEGQVLGVVTNQRADDAFLNQLISEKASIESARVALEKRREHLATRRTELAVRAADSLRDLKHKTGIQLKLVENEMFTAREELDSITNRIDRYKKANDDYDGDEAFAVVSRSQIESLEDRRLSLQSSLSSQTKAISLLQNKLDSAVSGSFVSENTPLEQQQLIDVEQSLASLETEFSTLQLKVEKLATQIVSREQRLQMNTRHTLVAGVSGTVWDIGFPDGSYVNRGDSVVAIADTDTISVEGNFHQRYLDNIKKGDPATIDLMGSRQRLKGTVTEVKIRDQVKSADLSAFNLASPESNEFKVVVAFDIEKAEDVYIGQRAKLIISKSASSIVPSVLLFFNR